MVLYPLYANSALLGIWSFVIRAPVPYHTRYSVPRPVSIQMSLSPDHLLLDLRSISVPFALSPFRAQTHRWRLRFLFDVLPLNSPPPRSEHEYKTCLTSSFVLACASCSISLWLVLTQVCSVFFTADRYPGAPSSQPHDYPLSPVLSVFCHVFRAISVPTASVSLMNKLLISPILTGFLRCYPSLRNAVVHF